jgi:hypothetical protein
MEGAIPNLKNVIEEVASNFGSGGRYDFQDQFLHVTEDFSGDEGRRNDPQVGNAAEEEMIESEGDIF